MWPIQDHDHVKRTLSALWRSIPGTAQWWLLWATNPKFNVGVAGVFFAPDGRVLLLRHVFRRADGWGLPSGWVKRRETVEAAAEREVREETGCQCVAREVLTIKSGFRLRVEVVVLGDLLSEPGAIRTGIEIYEARLFPPDALPTSLLADHFEYVRRARARPVAGAG